LLQSGAADWLKNLTLALKLVAAHGLLGSQGKPKWPSEKIVLSAKMLWCYYESMQPTYVTAIIFHPSGVVKFHSHPPPPPPPKKTWSNIYVY